MRFSLPHSQTSSTMTVPHFLNSRQSPSDSSDLSKSDPDAPLVLIVDDNWLIQDLLRQMMEKDGYQVVIANSGQQALEVFARLQPDIVLLDASMPVMDGYTCCQLIQALPGGDRTPVLMITALEDTESVNRVFEAGAIDFVTKPINWAVLRQRVKRLLQQANLYKQLQTANSELQRLVSIDSLTQVANRRCFDETLEHELVRMSREQMPLALILCDVDFFKLYNDTYGHLEGDWCLKKIARAISDAVCRPGDLVARYGGEEFAIILPRTDAAGAVEVAKRVRNSVNQLQIPHAASQVSDYITVSMGITCTLPGEEVTPAKLIRAADIGLYRAKAQGRDRHSDLETTAE